jgi:hypothetical protein
MTACPLGRQPERVGQPVHGDAVVAAHRQEHHVTTASTPQIDHRARRGRWKLLQVRPEERIRLPEMT